MRRSWSATALYLSALLWAGTLVVAPLTGLVMEVSSAGPSAFWRAVTRDEAVAALWLSTWTAGVAAVINGVVGTALAWALVRWDIPGRRAVGALVDLPLAIPTLVAGVLIVALTGPATPVGRWLVSVGFPIAFAVPGILLALCFVTLPFVVRAVEPVLEELDPAEEEAAFTLGATQFQVFRRVLLPPLLPAIFSGAVQTFARALAEFGSLAAVSGNIPFKTLTAPVYVLGEVEAGDAESGAAVSVVLLAAALVLQPIARALTGRVA